jgi:hypothetical protein
VPPSDSSGPGSTGAGALSVVVGGVVGRASSSPEPQAVSRARAGASTAGGRRNRLRAPAGSAGTAAPGQPRTWRLMTSRWIWLVPSKIWVTLASRMYRSAGKSCV